MASSNILANVYSTIQSKSNKRDFALKTFRYRKVSEDSWPTDAIIKKVPILTAIEVRSEKKLPPNIIQWCYCDGWPKLFTIQQRKPFVPKSIHRFVPYFWNEKESDWVQQIIPLDQGISIRDLPSVGRWQTPSFILGCSFSKSIM